MIFVSMPCCYEGVMTLTNTSIRNCKGEISAFRPSIMIGVPAVCDSIVVAKVNSGNPITKAIFNTRRVADDFVLPKVRTTTEAEGRLRIALSGSPDTKEFLTTALVTVIQA